MPGKEPGHAIRLSVFRINRSCKPANPAFTISENLLETSGHQPEVSNLCFRRNNKLPAGPRLAAKTGGADRDRTDDLKLAKLALSQLSYGPTGSRRFDFQILTLAYQHAGGPGTS